MATRAPKLGGIAAVLGFSLSCVGLLIYLWSTFGGPIPLKPTGYRLTAYYRDATQLIAETDVRMAGVDVGRVVSVQQEGQLTKAEIEIDPADAPIPADTTSVLRRKTLLGEPFIQLMPGTDPDHGGRMLAENGTLPVGQTEPSVDLDEALRAFNPETRHNFRLVLHQLALGTKDEGTALNGALGNLRPTTEAGADVFGMLASQDEAVHTLIRDSGTTLTALSERRGDLRSLISAGNQVLSATASRNRALATTVKLLPPALAQLRPTLELANRVGADAAPLLRELDPASRQLTPTVRALHDLAPDLERTLRDLNPLLDAAPTGVPAFSIDPGRGAAADPPGAAGSSRRGAGRAVADRLQAGDRRLGRQARRRHRVIGRRRREAHPANDDPVHSRGLRDLRRRSTRLEPPQPLRQARLSGSGRPPVPEGVRLRERQRPQRRPRAALRAAGPVQLQRLPRRLPTGAPRPLTSATQLGRAGPGGSLETDGSRPPTG